MIVPLVFPFWFMLASYVVHAIDPRDAVRPDANFNEASDPQLSGTVPTVNLTATPVLVPITPPRASLR